MALVSLPSVADALPIDCGMTGSFIKNVGPVQVSFKDRVPISATDRDGVLAVQAGVWLYGVNWFFSNGRGVISTVAAKPTETSIRYRDAILQEQGLVAYWPLGENSPTTFTDVVGSRVASPSTALSVGEYAQPGLRVESSDLSVVAVPTKAIRTAANDDTLDFAGTAPFSVEAWVRPADFGAQRAIADTGGLPGTGASGPGWLLRTTTAARLQFIRSGFSPASPATTVSNTVSPAMTLVAGQVYHVVGAWDGLTGRVYINGSPLMVTTPSPENLVSIPDHANRLGLGCRADAVAGVAFMGGLQDVAVYSTALNELQAKAHYDLGVVAR